MDKVILITGSNQGIGYSLAKLLLERAPEYSKIIMTARNHSKGMDALQSLSCPERLDFQVLDVTNPTEIEEVSRYVRSTYGKLDVLVNNAAAGFASGENPLWVLQLYLNVNFYGLKAVTEAFLPIMPYGGHIVNMTSILGLPQSINDPVLNSRIYNPNLTMPELLAIANEFGALKEDWREKGWKLGGSGVYNISKGLVNAYTILLDKEFKRNGNGIRVNAVHPGWVKTRMGGNNAPLPVEQGAEIPLWVIKDESNISGKYWSKGVCNNFSL